MANQPSATKAFLGVCAGLACLIFGIWNIGDVIARSDCKTKWERSGYQFEYASGVCRVSTDGGKTFLPADLVRIDK